MKFFLQDCQTAKFMRCDSTWTTDMDEALDFLSERRAFFFGTKELKKSFQILKVATAEFLPVLIPRLDIPVISHARPMQSVQRLYAPILPAESLQPAVRFEFTRQSVGQFVSRAI